MEWLIIIGIALFVISKLGGSKKAEPAKVAVASRGPTVDDPGFADALSSWRKQVAGEFGVLRWVPASRIQEIAASYPMPTWKGSPLNSRGIVPVVTSSPVR